MRTYRWCLNTGKWLWRCQCRGCLPAADSAEIVRADAANG